MIFEITPVDVTLPTGIAFFSFLIALGGVGLFVSIISTNAFRVIVGLFTFIAFAVTVFSINQIYQEIQTGTANKAQFVTQIEEEYGVKFDDQAANFLIIDCSDYGKASENFPVYIGWEVDAEVGDNKYEEVRMLQTGTNTYKLVYGNSDKNNYTEFPKN